MTVPTGIQLAQQYLKTARNNLRDGDSNGACNRAYYASFKTLKGVLHLAGASAKTHKGARALFAQYFPDLSRGNRTSSKIFAALERARLAADYGDEVVPAEEALDAVLRAEGFVTAILEKFFPQALEQVDAAQPSAAKVPDSTGEAQP